jgi:hypothetical protein
MAGLLEVIVMPAILPQTRGPLPAAGASRGSVPRVSPAGSAQHRDRRVVFSWYSREARALGDDLGQIRSFALLADDLLGGHPERLRADSLDLI